MIRDRGSKKWTAIMLPEHIKELKHWLEKEHYTERPDLEDWELQSIQEEIEVASKRQCQTLVKTWKDGNILLHNGIVEAIDLRTMVVLLNNQIDTVRIPVSSIINVQCAD